MRMKFGVLSSEHEADVGAVGRIGEEHLLEVIGGNSQSDGDGEEIDRSE